MNFLVDAAAGAAGTIKIGGGTLGVSKKARNVQKGSTASLVVDDLASIDPWVSPTAHTPAARGGERKRQGSPPPETV